MNYRITVSPYIKNTYFGNEVKRWKWKIEVEKTYAQPVYEPSKSGHLFASRYEDVIYWSVDFDHLSYNDPRMYGENCKSAEEADQKAKLRLKQYCEVIEKFHIKNQQSKEMEKQTLQQTITCSEVKEYKAPNKAWAGEGY